MGEEPEAAQGPSLDRFLGQLSGKVRIWEALPNPYKSAQVDVISHSRSQHCRAPHLPSARSYLLWWGDELSSSPTKSRAFGIRNSAGKNDASDSNLDPQYQEELGEQGNSPFS